MTDKAREHYIPVGKSALRAAKKEGLAPLGPKYEGSRVSRANLYDDEDEGSEDEDGGVGIDELNEGDIKFGVASDDDDDIDSDDALCSEDEKFTKWKFGGSNTTEGGLVPKKGHKVVASDDEEEEDESEGGEEGESGAEGESGESEGEESGSGDDNESQSEDEGAQSEEDSEEEEDDDDIRQRKTLAKMMAQEKKYVPEAATIATSPNQTDLSPKISQRPPNRTPTRDLQSASSKRRSIPSSAPGSSFRRP